MTRVTPIIVDDVKPQTTPIPPPSAPRSPRNLELLPDFVLIEIFKHLPLVDLFNISLVNERFELLAISFKAAHNLNLAEHFTQPSAWTYSDQLHHSYGKLLTNVGQHINGLVLETFYVRQILEPAKMASSLILTMRRHHAATVGAPPPELDNQLLSPTSTPLQRELQQHLQHLPQTFNESAFLLSASQQIGTGLRHLRVRNCDLDTNWDDYAPLLLNLHTLHMESCRSQTGYRHWHMPILDYRTETIFDDTDDRMPRGRALLAMRQLREFTLIRCKHTLHVPQIVQLIAQNPNLQLLRVHHISNGGSATLVPTIARTLAATLHTLSLHYGATHENDLLPIAEMRTLQKLQLLNYYTASGLPAQLNDDDDGPQQQQPATNRPLEQLLAAMRANATIVELDLQHCRVSAVALDGMATWTGLRVLKLRKNYWLTAAAALAIGRIGRLESLDLYDALNLTDADMVEIVYGNPRLELLDASWVVQLTEYVVSELRYVITRRTQGQREENERRMASGQLPEEIASFRVILNGRNQIDWEKIRQRYPATALGTTAAEGSDSFDAFRAIAFALDGDPAKSAMFRVFYDACSMQDVIEKAEDWAKKYSSPIYEIN